MKHDTRLVYHSEVRWLSQGRVMERVWKLQEELLVWFNGREDHRAHLIQDLFWLARLAYLVDIFGLLNVLNIALHSLHLRKSFKVWKKFVITIQKL